MGIFCIIEANSFNEDRTDVIIYVSCGILIISATVINYIFYIKRNLKDLNPDIREKIKKNNIKIGEIIEFIFFIIFALTPIWRIPVFIELFEDKRRLIIEIIKAFTLSIASIILLFSLNPININEKIDKLKNRICKKTNEK